MHEYIIGEYIKKISINDILDYIKKNNLNINENEAIILHSYAKKYYKDFINGNPTFILKEIKEKISNEAYKDAYKLYIENKMKYLK